MNEALVKAVKAEFQNAKTGMRTTIETAYAWRAIVADYDLDTLSQLIKPVRGSDTGRMDTCVQHCPIVQTAFSDAAKIEDPSARHKAKTAAQRLYAIVWRGLMRGAAIAVLERHGMAVEARSRGEALPFVRVTSKVDGATKEQDTSITGVVQIATKLLASDKPTVSKPVASNGANEPTEKTVTKVSVSDLAALLSSRLTGRDLAEFPKETREEIECLYTVLHDLCQVNRKAA